MISEAWRLIDRSASDRLQRSPPCPSRAEGGRMVKKVDDGEAQPADHEAERKRLKSAAFSRNLLCRSPAKPLRPIEPSKAVLKHRGRDIVKKGQRKNKFLFSLPGLLAPVSGGKIGELTNLNTRNPVLYLEFPQVLDEATLLFLKISRCRRIGLKSWLI